MQQRLAELCRILGEDSSLPSPEEAEEDNGMLEERGEQQEERDGVSAAGKGLMM